MPRRGDGRCVHVATLTDPLAIANDEFASSVALCVTSSGATLVVGDPAYSPAPYNGLFDGGAFVLVRSGNKWTEQAVLAPPVTGETISGRAGSAVAISRNTVVVAAPDADPNYTPSSGAAYVFVRSGTTWTQQATLIPPLPSVSGESDVGESVAVSSTGSGTFALINGQSGSDFQAEVFLFTRSGTHWTRQSLVAPGLIVNGRHSFGASVALSGTTALISAPAERNGCRPAFVYVRSGRTWSKQASLVARTCTKGGGFGDSVAVAGSTALIGAPYLGRCGAAFAYRRSGKKWVEQKPLKPPVCSSKAWFGLAVAVSASTVSAGTGGTTAVVGAPGTKNEAGAAYEFNL
jgi:hypothetical protein